MAKWTAKEIASVIICSPCILCGFLTCICIGAPGPCGTKSVRRSQERALARQRRNATIKGKVTNALQTTIYIPRYICQCIVYGSCALVELVEGDPVEKRAMKRRKIEPTALPPRRRDLSITPNRETPQRNPVSLLPFGIRRKQLNVQQGKKVSLFLTLPLEIRQRIISEAIGNKVLHLVQLPKRLGHIRCQEPHISSRHNDPLRNCIYPAREFGRGSQIGKNATSDGCLALLKTCRQLYVESVKVLYETNTFDINHAQTLVFLNRTILPKRLEAIRYLQVTWRGERAHTYHGEGERYQARIYPDDLATWNTMWDIVGGNMKGLRSLKVCLCNTHPHRDTVTKEVMDKLLDGLRGKVRGLSDFELEITGVGWDFNNLEMSIKDIVCAR
jgi:hypothetical protein